MLVQIAKEFATISRGQQSPHWAASCMGDLLPCIALPRFAWQFVHRDHSSEIFGNMKYLQALDLSAVAWPHSRTQEDDQPGQLGFDPEYVECTHPERV